ncbi:hypothetical protein [Streptomyces sp. NPDC050988]|uniref:hypothetical protein n=1 Tax=Streptomyces sp. NPDC050988 TaxID=3365637 RepID=UPI0037909B64
MTTDAATTAIQQLRAEVAAIEKSLVNQEWIPGRLELRLGGTFLTRSKQIDEDRRPSWFPPPRHVFDRWRTHHFTYHARLTEEAEQMLSALWVRLLLRRSPMRRLVAAYAVAGRELLPYAERMRSAFDATPPVLDEERVGRHIRQSGLHPAEAKDQIWRETVNEWEERHLPAAEFVEPLEPAEYAMSRAATVMVAAVTGDITY